MVKISLKYFQFSAISFIFLLWFRHSFNCREATFLFRYNLQARKDGLKSGCIVDVYLLSYLCYNPCLPRVTNSTMTINTTFICTNTTIYILFNGNGN